jgi:anti-sigma-K factor RskA
MMARTMDELRELAPAYVMDTLDPNERATFEAALASSSELASEVAEHRAVVEALATEHAIAPPPSLRNALLRRIADERPARPPAASAAAFPYRPHWITSVVITALAAALVFAIADGRRNAGAPDAQITALHDSARVRDSVLADVQGKLHQRDTALNTIVGAESGLLVLNLGGGNAAGPGAQLFWNPRQGRGVLHAFRLATAPAGRAYQLWLITNGRPTPVRVFNTDSHGHGLFTGFDLPRDPKVASGVMITEEKAAGASQPTSAPFLSAGLPGKW